MPRKFWRFVGNPFFSMQICYPRPFLSSVAKRWINKTLFAIYDLTKTTSDDKEIEKLTKPSFYSNKGRAGQL